jgi:hypothetical protein
MPENLTLEFSMRLGRANRSEIAALSERPLAVRRAIADGQTGPTLEALAAVLEEIAGLSVFEALGLPTINYEVEDPSDAPLFSEAATVTVSLAILTSPAHRAALAHWAARSPDGPPLLFEPELRAAIRAMTAQGA